MIDEDVVDLGVLTGHIGDQNYAILDGVDLDRYDTVVIPAMLRCCATALPRCRMPHPSAELSLGRAARRRP